MSNPVETRSWSCGVCGYESVVISTLMKVLRHKKPCRLFWGDMTDLFGEWVTDEMLDRCFAVMALTPHITHQVLTKRPERMREYLSDGWGERAENIGVALGNMLDGPWVWNEGKRHRAEIDRLIALSCGMKQEGDEYIQAQESLLPLPNVHLGVSAENQEQADARIPILLETPAAVRFVSAEPLLANIQVSEYLRCCCVCSVTDPNGDCPHSYRNHENSRPRLDWLIVGGESGSGARPCDVQWIRSIVEQCKAAGVPVFVKQLGAVVAWPGMPSGTTNLRGKWRGEGWPYNSYGNWRPTFGRVGNNVGELTGLCMADSKGGDPAEWPADLRVREMPEGAQ